MTVEVFVGLAPKLEVKAVVKRDCARINAGNITYAMLPAGAQLTRLLRKASITSVHENGVDRVATGHK